MWNNTSTELHKARTMDHVQRLQEEIRGDAGRLAMVAEAILVGEATRCTRKWKGRGSKRNIGNRERRKSKEELEINSQRNGENQDTSANNGGDSGQGRKSNSAPH